MVQLFSTVTVILPRHFFSAERLRTQSLQHGLAGYFMLAVHFGVVSGSPHDCPCDQHSHANQKGEVEAHASSALEPTQSGEARADSEGGRNMGELCSTRAYKFTTGANVVRRSQLLARSAVRLRHAASESIRVTRRRRSFLASCFGLFCHFDRHCQRRDRGCCRYYHAGSVFCSPLRRLCSIKWRLPLNAVYTTFAPLACVEAIPAYKHIFFTESRELEHLMHESAPPLTPLLVVRTCERCYRFSAYRRVFSSLSLWLGQSAACCVQLRCSVS